ncbi:MAG: 30S ribosomal protein S17e [Thermoplasmatales archaeon]|nr:30S ribosomal protein S17e [Thermoplasmatales archaeon]
MGNIRSTFIKRIAREFIEKCPEQFVAGDFQHNKKKVAELADIQSNTLRNRVAGYITRLLAPSKKGNYNEEQDKKIQDNGIIPSEDFSS